LHKMVRQTGYYLTGRSEHQPS